MKNSRTLSATLAALGAQVIFGFSFMFTKIALGYTSPLTVIADRYIAAFIGLSIVMVATRTKIKRHKSTGLLILMSILQPVLYFIFESYGIRMTTSSFSSIMISMIPVVSMVSGIFVLKEIPSKAQYAFTALSVLGVVITALAGSSDGTVTPAGILLLFLAVLSSVGYNVLSRKISAEFTPLERTYSMTVIGLVVFLAISFAENINNPVAVVSSFTSIEYTLSILYLGIVSSVAAFIMLNYANTYLPVAKTTVFTNITTVVSVIAGAIFLNEKISPAAIIATVMIVSGVWGVQKSSIKNLKS